MAFHQIVIVLLATVASTTVHTRQSGSPDGVAITQVNNNGNGCSGNSTSITITPDQTIVLSRLNDFRVSTGPDISPAERSKNCAIHVSVTYPNGWQFRLVQSTYSGYAYLDPGVAGHFYAQYFVSSNAENTVCRS